MAPATPSSSPSGTRSTRRTGTNRDPHRGDTKRRIVDAAERLVVRDGVGHLTLEAAAAEADLSKGGVLYHFGTRDALVTAMVTRIIEEFEEDVDSHLPDPDTDAASRPGAYSRAYLRASLEPSSPGEERLGAALLAAAAAEPALLLPLQEAAAVWQARISDDGLDPATATLVRLACDGLWLCGLFGLAVPDRKLVRSVGERLEALVTP